MHRVRMGLVVTSSCLISACTEQADLRLTVAAPRADYAELVAEAIELDSGIRVDVVPAAQDIGVLGMLTSRRADLGLLHNNASYARNVAAVMPLYTSVLHVLHRNDIEATSLEGLLRGRRVFAGAPEDTARALLKWIDSNASIGQPYEIVEDPSSADVILLFSPIRPALIRPFLDRYSLFSTTNLVPLHNGSTAQAITVLFPAIKNFVIPEMTYGPEQPNPIVTISVDTLLIASEFVSESEMYQVTESIISSRAWLAAVEPGLFASIREDFDRNQISLPLHTGAERYFRREEPSLLERYAEVINVGFYLLAALLSGGFAFYEWRTISRRERIDLLYDKALMIRRRVRSSETRDKIFREREALGRLEDEAFQKLMDEKLSRDEGFLIFAHLCRNVKDETNQRLAELSSTSTSFATTAAIPNRRHARRHPLQSQLGPADSESL